MKEAVSPIHLASLAVAVMPDLKVAATSGPHYLSEDFQTGAVIDTEGNTWIVTIPRSPMAGATMEAQNAVLDLLGQKHDEGKIGFDVPRPVALGQSDGQSVLVTYPCVGTPLKLSECRPRTLAGAIGRAIAQLHELDPLPFYHAGLPAYSPQEQRDRHHQTIAAADRTGLLPARVKRHWENILANDDLWDYLPTLAHQNLEAEHFHTSGKVVMAMGGFTQSVISDPAADLVWALVGTSDDFFAKVLAAYARGRGGLDEDTLQARAQFLSELAIATYLYQAVEKSDEAAIAEATEILAEIDADLASLEPEEVLAYDAQLDSEDDLTLGSGELVNDEGVSFTLPPVTGIGGDNTGTISLTNDTRMASFADDPTATSFDEDSTVTSFPHSDPQFSPTSTELGEEAPSKELDPAELETIQLPQAPDFNRPA
ncbi:hypothetical protein BK816_02600 [Boudabousia tangfeifanii]|uniref:Aminoglycoside phosphotransferase domain-containing protein n=1 Tax=Boudabousia tangfeifanii TaxID=1912795 RepID=A0A1D9MJ45_9ACTO|nr:phosphotransferase [Boudabousia tangfeifanii]AOZ72325.1 hypothetical protein BK816_02600 [Boudabousia tangfeifanii]